MKKLLSIIALTLFTSTQALASMPFTEMETIEESAFDFEIKIANNDNSIANLVNGYIDLATTMAEVEFNDKELQITNLFLEEIEGKNMQINTQTSGTWFQVEQSTSDFQELLSEIDALTSIKEETSGSTTSYEFRFGDMAFANINDKLVLSDSNRSIFLHDEEISSQSINLSSNEILSVEGEIDGSELDYSISENNGVLTATSSAELSSEIDLNSFNSTSHLYDDLKSDNPVMYVEFTQALNLIKGFLPEEERSNLDEELEFELGEDLPSFESIFNKQTALLFDFNETIIPEITLAMADMSSSEVSEIMSLFNEELSEDIENSEFSITNTDINSQLKRITITPTAENVEADLLNIDEIVITYGLYEGNFIITNNADVLTQSTTVSDNSSFSNSFAASKSDVSGISYVDFAAIADQISVYEQELSRLDEAEVLGDSSDLKEILTEMGIWSGYSYADGNQIKEAATFKIPSDLLLEQLEVISEDTFGELSSFSYSPYSDVTEDAWYYEEVAQAYEMFIIDTFDYETETFSFDFRPGEDITRGEFVQMIVAAYELEGESIDQFGSDIFSDVESGSYFDFAIGAAFDKGIIKGDDGANTFRPNETLNRAEAVQILYNASPLLTGKQSTANQFKDVPQGVWYENVVSVAVQEAIVKGINPEEFAPAKNLNRAEAVTLLIRLVNNEVRF